MSVLAAIAVLAVLIFVHELGHFSAARLQNIHVNRFSLGFGPILLKYQGTRTEYALRAIPLGGFVGFPDDDPESIIPPEDPNLLRNRPILDRAIVISAGVIANLIFAYLLLVMQFGLLGIPFGIAVPEVQSGNIAVAQEAGMESGDIIIAVDSEPLAASPNAVHILIDKIQNSPGKPLDLTLQRGKETIDLSLTPALGKDGKGKIGVSLSPNRDRRRPNNLTEPFNAAGTEFQNLTNLTLSGFGKLIGNFQETASQVAGPVKIVEYGANIARYDAGSLFQFAALISINLAIINILPLPALDGGQLAFLVIEGLRGKPLPSRIQDGIMQTGLVVLLGLGMFLIIRDTANLEVIQELFQ